MIWAVSSVLLAIAGGGFAWWLGYGRRNRWERVAGWESLEPGTRRYFENAAATYMQETNLPEVIWHGHASIEIKWLQQRILFDPVASMRVSIAPRWICRPILDTSQPSAAIFLSHAHMDHLDNPTLERIPATRLYLPRGTERFLSRAVMDRHEVLPLALEQGVRVGHDVEVVPVPARHGGWRYPWQRGLFAFGFVMRHGETTVYIAGDSAAGPHFAEIGRRYAPRLAVLPISAYAPQWFLQKRHLNPEEAVAAARVLGVDYVVPCHFGTYRLSLEPMNEPLIRFAKSIEAAGIPAFIPLPSDPASPGRD
jgi:L-ascorbate metabolism protein UlaG (beta-lactamase superfamily)